ncbi:glutamate receptor ionotropic, NMDA 2B-like isoform X2 [Pollicipes pollicipes]|uniref:glutamate receptor ionotropic, NMDA 2B-like isoform X2 n=2 Tax=Pollicipes pollicipes TaxID=41117 RepID=UPI001884EC9E|nr:glutamate receptor ionotropic, NMDA 2B-like isoform X2 [Pollicipes pollicipes]XP_037074060.1 glutamate receptor ionotropic, NMDA 2B-like isoform X2 [Pollicipes pollicipes]
MRSFMLCCLLAATAAGVQGKPTPEGDRQVLRVGALFPSNYFLMRHYRRQLHQTIHEVGKRLTYRERYEVGTGDIMLEMMESGSSPITILETLCDKFLPNNVTAIFYLTNSERYGRSTASSQYFIQLAGYLGLPVICWNADNSGLERDQSGSQAPLQLQMAPTIQQQVGAMLSILVRYNWHRLYVVTSQIAGHKEFIQAAWNQAADFPDFKFTIIGTLTVADPATDLPELSQSEARIILLYSTRDEAVHIMRLATSLGITGKNYVWIVTQSVQGSSKDAPDDFPIGMLGVHFKTDEDSMIAEIGRAMAVYAHGLELLYTDKDSARLSMQPALSCVGSGQSRWPEGERFYRYLRNVSVPEGMRTQPDLQFDATGGRTSVELTIRNLRSEVGQGNVWEPIGTWRSWGGSRGQGSLDIKDIVWPGYSHLPPEGVPEKFHLRVAFMEDSPYVMMDPPDPISGTCAANKGVLCRVANESVVEGLNLTEAMRDPDIYRCCSGFCIDLLEKFADDLGFTYDLFRTEDGLWGALVNEGGKKRWNGLPGVLINKKADMVMTSFKINSYRQTAVDFTVPFLDTGISIVVSKRTGIISPTAFLEPFDTASWLLVSLMAIQAAAAAIFVFEWLSPIGYDMKMAPPSDYKFSLFRTLWMVWAILFQAAVELDVPRGYTARFMANVWALFALIFLAIYTANLAAFMITREEYYNLDGIDDERLRDPRWKDPHFRFGTVLHGNTDALLKQNFPEMHHYMLKFNKSSVVEGIKAVKRGELDAFIYDSTVLEYHSGQDDECRLLTVGQWYAMTGYGVGFPRNSKYIDVFNERIMNYRQNGDLERLHRFWFTGACRPNQQKKSSSNPLTLDQFLSTFLLLGCGILLSGVLLGCEFLYFRYIRPRLARVDKVGGCCSLVSLSMGRSLNFRGVVLEAQNTMKQLRRCRDPACDTHLWRVKHELRLAQARLAELEHQCSSHGLSIAGAEPGRARPNDIMDGGQVRQGTPLYPSGRAPYLYSRPRSEAREVAELETVL